MQLIPSYRRTYNYAFIIVIALLVFDAYLQVNLNVMPCLLTYAERVIFLFLSLAFLSGGLHNHSPISKKIHNWFAIIISLIGVATALRHVLLQHGPFSQPNVMLPAIFNKIFLMFPFLAKVVNAYAGTADCAQISWAWQGISLATWTLFIFIFFTLVSFWQQYRD